MCEETLQIKQLKSPWESKMIKEIEKAILASDLGLTPGNDGKVIRIVFPELTAHLLLKRLQSLIHLYLPAAKWQLFLSPIF